MVKSNNSPHPHKIMPKIKANFIDTAVPLINNKSNSSTSCKMNNRNIAGYV